MNVLIDIEWVQENETFSITQFAAVRVTEDWKAVDAFERLVCPEVYWNADWQHMAYSGYTPDEFRTGVSEETCIADFVDFLDYSDTIICWQKDAKRLLMQKVSQYRGKPLPVKCKSVNQAIYTIARAKGNKAHGLYELAEEIGLETPVPIHQSVNDVAVLRRLLAAFEYDAKAVQKAVTGTSEKKNDRRARNADILSRVEYNYIFTPKSKVFHSPSCHLILNATDIKGCTYYKTAIKERSPCKICRPEPNERPKKVKVKTEQEEPASSKPIEKQIIYAKLLGDRRVEITNVKIVGYCHNMIHPGKLTRKIMEAHDCLGKNCKYFERYPESTYWHELEAKRKKKEQRKKDRQTLKAVEQKLEDELAELKEVFQSYIDDAGYSMFIVRMEKEIPNRYRVFYVSDNPFADGNRFPDFLDTVKFFFPHCSINLRHIKNIDGHFVTTEEYFARRR